MLTDLGARLTADALTGVLSGGSMLVGNGRRRPRAGDTELAGAQQAEAPIEVIEAVDGRVILRATFGADEANFEWRERGLRTAAGELYERVVVDQGRKVEGSVWRVEAMVELE